jgi:hypothetical protein
MAKRYSAEEIVIKMGDVTFAPTRLEYEPDVALEPVKGEPTEVAFSFEVNSEQLAHMLFGDYPLSDPGTERDLEGGWLWS